jgi:phenylalanyl-tRNA synthetase beta chain
VDITNFVNLEAGQPLHAFDLAKLAGRKLVIRRAGAGEKLATLDGAELELSADDLVIADAERAVALAGVIGGADSQVTAATEAVVIESAYFDPSGIRRTAKRYGLSTESSYRFERGTDPAQTLAAANRAAAMMAELAGGKVIAPAIDAGRKDWARASVTLRPLRANIILGTALSGEAMADFLRRLFFGVTLDRKENLIVTVPSFRRDVNTEIELIEELARAYGYENVEPTLPQGRPPAPARNAREEFERKTREVLTAAGFYEVYSPTFTNGRELAAYGFADGAAAPVANPKVSQFSHLRPAVWPALAEAAARNGMAGAAGVLLYELGTAFEPTAGGPPKEASHLALLAAGAIAPAHWSRRAPAADFFAVKGFIAALAAAHGVAFSMDGEAVTLGDGAGRYFTLALEPFGTAHVVEVDVTPLPERAGEARAGYQPVSRFPSVIRDLALVIDESVAAGRVLAAVRRSSELAREVTVFDVFTGEGIPAGKKSLGVRVRYQADGRTLTDDEANAAREKAVAALAAEFGAALRS